MGNILYVIDDTSSVSACLDYARKRHSGIYPKLYICPMSADSSLVGKFYQVLSKCANVETLPFIKEFNKNAFKERDKFIKFLSDFSAGRHSGVSIRKYFTHPFLGFSMWWLSLVQEKSTVKKLSYHNLAKLVTIFQFADRCSVDEIYVDIENKALNRALLKNKGKRSIFSRRKPGGSVLSCIFASLIKALGYITLFTLRKITVHVILGGTRAKRIEALRNSEFLFVTYFPFADKKMLQKNIFKNIFLGTLQESIENRFKEETSWVGMLHDNTRLNINNLKLIRRINTWGYNIFIPEEFISFGEIASLLIVFIVTCAKFLMKLPYIINNFALESEGMQKKLKIWDLFQEEWIYSFCGSYLTGGLFYYHAFYRAFLKLKKDGTVIYPAEFYAWENAMNIARKKSKKALTVGVQHTTVPLLLLKYFNYADDLKAPEGVDQFPLPDYLATSGSIPRRLFLESGVPEERVFDTGAIRYHRLSRALERKTSWEARKKQAVIALSSAKEEAEEMLSLLWRAFRDIDLYNFIIRPHPACSLDKIGKPGGLNLNSAIFTLNTEDPLEELLVASRLLIVAGSSASFDGLTCNCPVIITRLSRMADMNPLSGFKEDLATYVENERELKDAAIAIMDSEKPPLDFDKARSFIDNYFTLDANPESYFARFEKEMRRK